jgi:hypothetical protein
MVHQPGKVPSFSLNRERGRHQDGSSPAQKKHGGALARKVEFWRLGKKIWGTVMFHDLQGGEGRQ